MSDNRRDQQQSQGAQPQRRTEAALLEVSRHEPKGEQGSGEQVRRVDRGGEGDADHGQHGPAADEQGDGRHQQDAEHGRLEHGAEQVLPGDTGLQIPDIIPAQPVIAGPAHRGRVDGDQQGEEDGPASGRRLGTGDRGEQAEQGGGVDDQEQAVVKVEHPRRQEAGGHGHQGTEAGSRIERVGQPVLAQQDVARRTAVGEAVQEILILVGIVQRCLAVGGREGPGPEQKQQDGAGGARGRVGHGNPQRCGSVGAGVRGGLHCASAHTQLLSYHRGPVRQVPLPQRRCGYPEPARRRRCREDNTAAPWRFLVLVGARAPVLRPLWGWFGIDH